MQRHTPYFLALEREGAWGEEPLVFKLFSVEHILILGPFTFFIGLSYVIRKDLCEARVNLEVSSYLADEPSFANGPPVNQE